MKKKLRIADRLIIAAFLLWAIETVFFLIRDGWHWEPMSGEEVILDEISRWLTWVGVMMHIIVARKAVDIIATNEDRIRQRYKNN